MVSVIHTDKGKAKVTAVMGVPKGATVPDPVNPCTAFWLDEFSAGSFDKVPEGIRKIIEKSDEFKALHGEKPATTAPAEADGIPF
jgi:hypothetical protein